MATIGIERGSFVERWGYMDFTVSLSNPVTDTVQVNYRTKQGTALESIDFRGSSGTITFTPGETSKVIQIYVYGDSQFELDESLVVELFDPVNATLPPGLATLSGTGWILDDDGIGNKRAMHVSNPMVRERDSGGHDVDFVISLSRPFSADTRLNFTTRDGTATAGQDYIAKAGRVDFFAGQTEAVVTVRVLGDTLIEGTEYFYLDVTPRGEIASGAIGSIGRATILDNDTSGRGPSITVEGGRLAEGWRDLDYIVTLSQPSAETVAVKYRTINQGTASEGFDYRRAPSSGDAATLIFAPGETSKVIQVYIYGDSISESDESIVLELFDPSNAILEGGLTTTRTTGWILDDDNLGNQRAVFVLNPVVQEVGLGAKSFALFDISLSRPSTERIEIKYETGNGTARAGQDYVASKGRVVFEPGQTEVQVKVEVLPDSRLEANETFFLRLIPPFPFQIATTSAGLLGTATILDSSILGGIGPDTLFGTAANDVIFGRAGNDTIYGLRGDDVLFGEAGNDRLYGGSGKDKLYGDAGNDLLDGGRGADTMIGGRGNDTYVVDNKGDRVIEQRDNGTDTVRASIDYKLPNHVENLTLTGGKSLSGTGNGLDNVLRGNKGANVLDGGAGNDRLVGGAGNDTLIGGLGRDMLTGGPGRDTFVFNDVRESLPGVRRDTIRDFERGRDTIDLSDIDANVGRAGDQAFAFVGAAPFSGKAGELTFRGGIVAGDIDGDGRADFEIAVLAVARLSADDFLL